ncbi:MAG: hypothetical protein CMJ74_03125 [Planctomycetaceae bacterium]|nr:hypothetical protein [Planctomycetaceae bacterium]
MLHRMLRKRRCLLAGFLITMWVPACAFGEQQSFRLEQSDHGKKLVTPDGRTVFQYMTQKPEVTNLSANSTCCLYPLLTPKGVRVVDLAPGDHRHHRGVFLAWHAMEFADRADFWGWGAMAPTNKRKITNREIRLLKSNSQYGTLLIRNDWEIDSRKVVDEQLTITTREKNSIYLIDLEYLLTPTENMTLDESAFGGFCVKSRQDGKRAFFGPQGEVQRPKPHHLKPDTDWPNAPFYDFTFTLNDGTTAGVSVVNSSGNPPTRWHNLISIAMINPCIVTEGPVTIAKDQTLRLKYRLIVHDGQRPDDPSLLGRE